VRAENVYREADSAEAMLYVRKMTLSVRKSGASGALRIYDGDERRRRAAMKGEREYAYCVEAHASEMKGSAEIFMRPTVALLPSLLRRVRARAAAQKRSVLRGSVPCAAANDDVVATAEI